jgi:hypothetical protein
MSSAAQLDVRVPIGAMFAIDGLVMAVYGLVSAPTGEAAERIGVNINLWWGLLLLAFGGGMLLWRRFGGDGKSAPHA